MTGGKESNVTVTRHLVPPRTPSTSEKCLGAQPARKATQNHKLSPCRFCRSNLIVNPTDRRVIGIFCLTAITTGVRTARRLVSIFNLF